MPPPAPPNRRKGNQVSLVDSFRRLSQWLREQGAPALADGFAPGTKPLQLSRLEQKVGYSVPPGLRALWLMHDGQARSGDGLVGGLQLLPVSWVLNERAATLTLLARLRANAAQLKRARLTPVEAESDRWLPIARGGDKSLVVNADSGRVFAATNEAPSLTPLAGSVAEWLSDYVDQVERGEYDLAEDEEGWQLVRAPDAD